MTASGTGTAASTGTTATTSQASEIVIAEHRVEQHGHAERSDRRLHGAAAPAGHGSRQRHGGASGLADPHHDRRPDLHRHPQRVGCLGGGDRHLQIGWRTSCVKPVICATLSGRVRGRCWVFDATICPAPVGATRRKAMGRVAAGSDAAVAKIQEVAT